MLFSFVGKEANKKLEIGGCEWVKGGSIVELPNKMLFVTWGWKVRSGVGICGGEMIGSVIMNIYIYIFRHTHI